ncbi:MAG: thermonuclease family protein [Thermodesulfobacteriota bacterium]
MPRVRRAAVILVLAAACAAVLAAAAPSGAASFRGTVVRIRDGDSVDVLRDRRPVKVRVLGVDAPERGQPFSARAKSFTADLVGGREVLVEVKDVDRYGRIVGDVVLDDGRRLGRELVRAGLAWHYRRYSSDPELARLEGEARSARRGLWADPHPTPPWAYRDARRGRPHRRRGQAPSAPQSSLRKSVPGSAPVCSPPRISTWPLTIVAS